MSDLRDQITEALAGCLDCASGMAALAAVMRVVEPEIERLTQRAEQAEAAVERVRKALEPAPNGAAFAIHRGPEDRVQAVVPTDSIRAALQPVPVTDAQDCPIGFRHYGCDCEPVTDADVHTATAPQSGWTAEETT